MKIRIQIDNKEKILKPEMFANVSVMYHGDSLMISIPSKAIIFDKSKNFVMVYKDRCDIRTREIQIYSNINNKAYILSGLKPDEYVISKSQLLIYNALNN